VGPRGKRPVFTHNNLTTGKNRCVGQRHSTQPRVENPKRNSTVGGFNKMAAGGGVMMPGGENCRGGASEGGKLTVPKRVR